MNISELQARQGKVEIVGEITKKDEPREFEKFGKSGKVCNAELKDQSGSITLTLWNEQVDTFNVGDKVKISNGWVSEWQGEKQLSTGKFGKIEHSGSSPMMTNDPSLLKPEMPEEEFVSDDLE